jgi:hypothetical protein
MPDSSSRNMAEATPAPVAAKHAKGRARGTAEPYQLNKLCKPHHSLEYLIIIFSSLSSPTTWPPASSCPFDATET